MSAVLRHDAYRGRNEDSHQPCPWWWSGSQLASNSAPCPAGGTPGTTSTAQAPRQRMSVYALRAETNGGHRVTSDDRENAAVQITDNEGERMRSAIRRWLSKRRQRDDEFQEWVDYQEGRLDNDFSGTMTFVLIFVAMGWGIIHAAQPGWSLIPFGLAALLFWRFRRTLSTAQDELEKAGLRRSEPERGRPGVDKSPPASAGGGD